MNRDLAPSKGDLYRGAITLEARCDLPAGGASVSTTSLGKAGDQAVGTQGWARSGVGLLTWTLAEHIAGPVFVYPVLEKATAEALWVEIVSVVVSTAGSTPVITLRTVNGAGAATDCTNACKIHVLVRGVDISGQ